MRFVPLILAASLAIAADASHGQPRQAPELTHSEPGSWINSPPLSLAGLRGSVVLIEFWTFDCINCRRSLPWLSAMHERYEDEGLVVIGVHTPELPQERDPANVRDAVARLGVTYPVMLDADYSYWNALDNRYWPAFYVVGPTGRVEATAIGELHLDDPRGVRFEGQIRSLLADRRKD
jgi:thiol-disulfide isomerase/thioredoxin